MYPITSNNSATSRPSISPVLSKPRETTMEPVRRKGRRQKPVIHPIFEQASRYVSDSFWVARLMDAAKGVFPQNITYSKDNLIYSTKRKAESQPLSGLSPDMVADTFYTFVRKHTTLSSDNDDRLSRMEIMSAHRDSRNVTNKEIQFLLDEYANKFSEYYQLSHSQKASLLSTLQIGYHMSIYNNKTVTIENGMIVHVPYVEFDQASQKFYISHSILQQAYDSLRRTVEQTVDMNADSKSHEMHQITGREIEKDWRMMSEALDRIGPKPQPTYNTIF